MVLENNSLRELIESYDGAKVLQHSDVIAGWIERTDKEQNFSGNLMKRRTGEMVIIDFDWGCISNNLLISLFGDAVKLDLYLFDRPEKSAVLKSKAISEFEELNLDLDYDLSWNLYTFLQTTLWEMPYWIRAIQAGDENKIAYNCFNWTLDKLQKSSEYLLRQYA